MKTTNKIFSKIFLGLGFASLVAGIAGALHQLAIAAICFVFYIVLTADINSEIKES